MTSASHYNEGKLVSFTNVRGVLEDAEKSARIGAKRNRRWKDDGVAHIRFSSRNDTFIHVEVRCEFEEIRNLDNLKMIDSYVVYSLGHPTVVSRNRDVILGWLALIGGYPAMPWETMAFIQSV